MNVELSIDSISGRQTVVTINFPTESLLREAGV